MGKMNFKNLRQKQLVSSGIWERIVYVRATRGWLGMTALLPRQGFAPSHTLSSWYIYERLSLSLISLVKQLAYRILFLVLH